MAEAEGRSKGTVLLWLGISNMYSGSGERAAGAITTMKEVLEMLADEDVIVIGPLPRGCDILVRKGPEACPPQPMPTVLYKPRQ